ncbi:MAG: hypothetical protein HYR97_03490 [Candidatus Melainabacteria bacterium]|nr:hypothetical protein [Candidatus Melainabacteria bacterium]MBI3308558.1 hypothetical protein [Candidatus Melainabacteria bacterium]
MFLLSIIPLYLNTDSDGIQVNTANQADVAEHRVMELEALLSSMIIKQYYSGQVEGVNSYDINSIRSALEAARAEELALMIDTGSVSDNDTYARLDYTQRMEAAVDQRISDLSALLAAINSGTQLGYTVSGVVNDSFVSVATELERQLIYKQELEISKEYWSQVIASKTSVTSGETTEPPSDEDDTGSSTVQPLDFSNREQQQAFSRRAIANLQSIIGSISQNTDVTELLSQIEAITSELKREMKLANIVVSSDGSNQSQKSVNSLNAELKTLFNQKDMRELLSGVESSVRSQLFDAFNELSLLLG